MLFFLINLAFANPNETTTTQNTQSSTSKSTSDLSSDFDFLSEKKETNTSKDKYAFDDSEFMIDASIMDSNDTVLVPQMDDSLLLNDKKDTEVTSLPEDTLLLSEDIELEEAKQDDQKQMPKTNINSTDSYDTLMDGLE